MGIKEAYRMYYLIQDKLIKTTNKERKNSNSQYVAVISHEEWNKEKESFELGIDLEIDAIEIYSTN